MTHDLENPVSNLSQRPYLFKFRSSKRFILATVCFAIFTDAFMYGVVVPVLPFSLQNRSGVPENQVQWWTSLLFAVFGAAIVLTSPLFGYIADHTSDRAISYYLGLLLLIGATILLAVAKKAWILVVSRTLQGLSASITYTVGLALLVDTVGRDDIGQYMGTALSASSFGLIVSPLAGGIIYEKAGYTAVFSVAIAIAVIDILMRFSMIEKRKVDNLDVQEESNNGPSNYNTFQNTSGIESRGSTTSEEDINEHSGSIVRPVQFPSSQETTTLINKRHIARKGKERQRSKPAIFRLLASPRLLAAIYGIFVNVGILATFDGVLPLFVKDTFHWNSLHAGLIFLCLAIPALAGPIVGALSDRVGPRWIAVTGCTLTTIPLVLLRLVEHNTVQQKVLLCALLFLSGCTLICIVSPVAADLSAVVEEMEEENPGSFGPGGAYAQAYALFNCAMASATLFGPMVFGALRQDHGWKVTTLCMAIFSLSGAVPSLFFTGGYLFEELPTDI